MSFYPSLSDFSYQFNPNQNQALIHANQQHKSYSSKFQVYPSSLWLTKSRQSALTLPCHLSDGVPVWTVPKSPSGELLKNGGLTPLRSAEPSPALRKRSLSHGAEVRNITSYCQISFCLPFPCCLGLLQLI